MSEARKYDAWDAFGSRESWTATYNDAATDDSNIERHGGHCCLFRRLLIFGQLTNPFTAALMCAVDIHVRSTDSATKHTYNYNALTNAMLSISLLRT